MDRPAKCTLLLESLQLNSSAIIEGLLDIDYLLLTYKEVLDRAQPHVNRSLVLTFIPVRKILNGADVEPVMRRFFIDKDRRWVMRHFSYEPGKLYLERAFGKNKQPFEQDSVVVILLKQIDSLLQVRKKLFDLTLPLRQNTNGVLANLKKVKNIATDKIDALDHRIVIDWSKPGSATDLVLKKHKAREDRATRKLDKKQFVQKQSNPNAVETIVS